VSPERKRELGPLPPGPHGFTREQIAHNQRERLIAALVELSGERPYGEVSIAEIIKKARVSRRTFYEHFKTKEECFLAAFDIVVDHLRDLIAEAVAPIEDWPHRVSAGIAAVLRFFAAEPDLARIAMVDSMTAGSNVAARYREAILGFSKLFEAGREERDHHQPLPPSTEDAVMGSISTVVSHAIMAGEAAELERLLPDLTEFALTPYLAPKEVRKLIAELDS
jgi:AcrR family transcriptional regulator